MENGLTSEPILAPIRGKNRVAPLFKGNFLFLFLTIHPTGEADA